MLKKPVDMGNVEKGQNRHEKGQNRHEKGQNRHETLIPGRLKGTKPT